MSCWRHRYITVQELDSLPSYMRSRLTQDKVPPQYYNPT